MFGSNYLIKWALWNRMREVDCKKLKLPHELNIDNALIT